MSFLTVPGLIVNVLTVSLVALLPVRLASAEGPYRLSRAYSQTERFSAESADTLLQAGPIRIHQFSYDGRFIRPDDTLGAKLKRIFAMSGKLSELPAMDILLIDTATPALTPAAPPDARLRICTYIQKDNDVPAEHPNCAKNTARSLFVKPAALITPTARSRFTDGMLNEIGHRIAAEAVFSSILSLTDVFSEFEPPPGFRKRINIYPNNNERLASIRHPDS